MRDDEKRTSLRGDEVVDKVSSEIQLRGRLDSLMAQAVLTAAYAEHFGYTNITMGAKDVVRVVGELQTAEARDTVPEVRSVLGFMLDELRDIANNPRAELGLDPYYPGPDTDLMTAYLNVLRAEVRSVELAYCAAPDTEVNRTIQLVLNRLSTAVYILMLECRSERV